MSKMLYFFIFQEMFFSCKSVDRFNSSIFGNNNKKKYPKFNNG